MSFEFFESDLVPPESLLAAQPSPFPNGFVQWLDTALKVHDRQQVAMFLSQAPGLLRNDYYGGMTALHLCARYGHDQVAVQLLTDCPELVDAINSYGQNALHIAAKFGHDKVVEVLLTKFPNLATTVVEWTGETALHLAVVRGNEKAAVRLLVENMDVAKMLDKFSRTPLHFAVFDGLELVTEILLANAPELTHVATKGRNDTVLHMASSSMSQNKQLYVKLLELNPDALRTLNEDSKTPFDVAVESDNHCAIESMQWALSFDEIVSAFTALRKSFEERLRPTMEGQCGGLLESLSQDVFGEVFEYLGFDTPRRPAKKGRPAE